MSDILMFDLFGNHLECDAVIEKEKQQLIISSPGYSSIALNAGMVQICQMDIDPVDSEETLNCFIIYGDNSTNEMFGYTVKAVDDLNYDGVKDLIVAAPFKNNNKGCIYLFTGLNPKIFNTYKMILSNTEDILNYGITIEYGPMIDLNGKINTLIIGSTGSITVYKVNPFIEIIMDFTIPTVLNRMTMPSNMSFPISYTMAPLTLIKIEQSLIFMCSNQLNITNQTCPYSIIITNNQNTGTLMGFMNYEIGLFESKTIDLSMTFSGKFNETLPLVQKTITKNIIYNGRCVNPDKPNNAKLISVDALLNKNTNENNLLLLFESDVNICSMELEMTFNSTIEKIVFGTLDEYIYEKQLIQNGIFYIKVSPVVNLSKKILLTIEILTNEKSQFIQATIKTLIVNAVLIIQNDMPIQWIIDEEAILIAEGSLSSSNMNIPFIIKTSTLIYYFIRLSNLMLISMKDVEIYLKINVNNAAIWDGNFIISGDDQASSSVNCILDNANKEMSDLFGYYERIIKCSTSLSLLNFTSFHLSFNLSISENLENVIFKVDMFTKSKAINNIVYNNYTYDVKSCNINTYTAEVKYEQRLQDWVIMIICIVIPPLICLIIGIIVIKLKILTKSFK